MPKDSVPKKLFVTGAAFQEHFKDAKGFGWDIDHTKIKHSWQALIAGKNKVVGDINASYEQMFVDAKMELVLGWGSLEDAHTVVHTPTHFALRCCRPPISAFIEQK